MRVGPVDDDTELDGTSGFNGWGTFDQLLDHSDPSKGTFEQRYWYGSKFWNGTGSPIVLTCPGEQSGDGFNVTYTTKQRITGLMAEAMGAAVVILEHRYWGGSSPFEVLTEENLQYLTLDNALKDLTYFAKNFDAPFDAEGSTDPKTTPWVFSGGSYSGALAGWLESAEPGTFWAYHGSSAVEEAVSDFWTYFAPVQDATPSNCSTDVNSVIEYVDGVLLHGSQAEKAALKARFMLEDLEDADFGAALENGPWSWQSTQFYTESLNGYNSYYQFCDYIENVFPVANGTNSTTGVIVPGAKGVGYKKALNGYVKWFTELVLPGYCESWGYDDYDGTYNTNCFKAMNSTNVYYQDLSVDNLGGRQWMWMLCNEPFEWWQNGAPEGRPTLVSRLVNVDYWRAQCGFYFPEGTYGLLEGRSVQTLNSHTGGWGETDTRRLMYANGQFDPWKDATVSADFRSGGPLESTSQLPVRVIPGGGHCSDLYGQNWAFNEEVKAIAEAEVEQMAEWVAEFYEEGVKRAVEWES
ncbi:peptidase S28 [Pseudomassariella vexata]|uniref:Peptidase S28 n=1 Tax=Pseudomassariella vexata TaxID=1141098 RepID=A0A1Y2DR28_9PEZI|nr:peptidase S28 [Pseudomassariella vexata]ORY61639.1 peptidase S28 [Pseudomassariella vexata]